MRAHICATLFMAALMFVDQAFGQCDPGSSPDSNNVCQPCGAAGTAACNGDTCVVGMFANPSTLLCDQPCGATNTAACDPAKTVNGLTCTDPNEVVDAAGKCQTCGGSTQPVCADGKCTLVDDFTDNGNGFCTACGVDQTPVCKDSTTKCKAPTSPNFDTFALCQTCGAVNQIPCLTAAGRVCTVPADFTPNPVDGKFCVDCGNVGEVACGGTTCNAPLTRDASGQCSQPTCGQSTLPPCSGGICASPLVLVPASNTCETPPCGKDGQPPCPGTPCAAKHVFNIAKNQCQACGALGQPICSAPGGCDDKLGLNTTTNLCAPCGEAGQPICEVAPECSGPVFARVGATTFCGKAVCGRIGQAACDGTTCDDPTKPAVVNTTTKLCEAATCGFENLPPCQGIVCNIGLQRNSAGVCQKCSGKDQAPCNGSICAAKLTLNAAKTLCVSCGADKELACNGTLCNTGLVVVTTTTPNTCGAGPCGGDKQDPCTGNKCLPNFKLNTVTSKCETCGAAQQPSCDGKTCTGKLALNAATLRCQPCGAENQASCNGTTCDAGLVLNSTSKLCVKAACGALGQLPCNGSTCNAGLTLSVTSKLCVLVSVTGACGKDKQPACNGTACDAGLVLKADKICEKPPCGAETQVPCTGSIRCNTGLQVVAGKCSKKLCGADKQEACNGTACNAGLDLDITTKICNKPVTTTQPETTTQPVTSTPVVVGPVSATCISDGSGSGGYLVEPKKDIPGTNYKILSVATTGRSEDSRNRACWLLCKADPRCVFAVVRPSNGKCWLKSLDPTNIARVNKAALNGLTPCRLSSTACVTAPGGGKYRLLADTNIPGPNSSVTALQLAAGATDAQKIQACFNLCTAEAGCKFSIVRVQFGGGKGKCWTKKFTPPTSGNPPVTGLTVILPCT